MKTFEILILIAVFLLWVNQLVFWGYERIKEKRKQERIKKFKQNQNRKRYQKRKNG